MSQMGVASKETIVEKEPTGHDVFSIISRFLLCIPMTFGFTSSDTRLTRAQSLKASATTA